MIRAEPRRADVARGTALRALLELVAASGAHRLTIERDDAFAARDRRLIATFPIGEAVTVYHLNSHEEPILRCADAVAWCVQRGGRWHERVRSLLVIDRAVI